MRPPSMMLPPSSELFPQQSVEGVLKEQRERDDAILSLVLQIRKCVSTHTLSIRESALEICLQLCQADKMCFGPTLLKDAIQEVNERNAAALAPLNGIFGTRKENNTVSGALSKSELDELTKDDA